MRFLTWSLRLALFLLLLGFAVKNDQAVVLRYFFGLEWQTSLVVALLCFFAAGVVIGLLAVTPIFTSDIAEQRRDAIDAGTAVILDSPVQPLLKLRLAAEIESRLDQEEGKVPTIGPAFEPLPSDENAREEVVQLRDELQDQLNRGATHAFSPSFGLAALIGLLSLIPIVLARRVEL